MTTLGVSLRATRPCRPEISRSRALEKSDLLVRQSGGVLKGLAYVFGFQFGILADNVLPGHSICHQIDDQRDRDSHFANASASSHEGRIERNPVEHAASLTVRDAVQERAQVAPKAALLPATS